MDVQKVSFISLVLLLIGVQGLAFQVKPLDLLYEQCRDEIKSERYEAAIPQAILIIDRAQELGRLEMKLKASAQLQYCYTKLGKPFDAYRTITSSLLLAEQLQDNLYSGYLHLEAGLTLIDLNDHEAALEHLTRSSFYYQLTQQWAQRNKAEFERATCLRYLGQYELARETLQGLIHEVVAQEQMNLLYRVYNELGLVALNQGAYDIARNYFIKIIEEAKSTPEGQKAKMYAFYNQTLVAKAEGQLDDLDNLYRHALSFAHPDWVNEEALVFAMRVKLYESDKNSLDLLYENDLSVVNHRAKRFVAQSYQHLIAHHKERGETDIALVYSQKHNALTADSFENAQEIERLYNLYRVKAMQLESQNQALRDNRDFMNLLWGICLGVLVTAAAAIIIFYYRRNRRFENQHRKMEAVFSKYS